MKRVGVVAAGRSSIRASPVLSSASAHFRASLGMSGRPMSTATEAAEAKPAKQKKAKKAKKIKQNDPFLMAINEEYAKYTAGSLAKHKEIKEHFAENAVWTHPMVVDTAKGAKFTDVDGNTYIDMVCGFGSSFLGNNNDLYKESLQEVLESNAYHVGSRPMVLKDAADTMCKAVKKDKAVFYESGTTAVQIGLRVARAYSKKDKILQFNFAWHGQADSTLFIGDAEGKSAAMSGGVPTNLGKDVLMYPFGTDESIQAIKDHADELACVLIEPVPLKFVEAASKEYTQAIRDACTEAGVLLFFDEMVSGFRIAIGGAQEYYGVEADIATYGKTVAAGQPIGVLTGRRDIMDMLGSVVTGSTFANNTLQLHALNKTVNYMVENKAWIYPQMKENMAILCDSVRDHAKAKSIPLDVIQFESIMRLDFDPKFQVKSLHIILAFLLQLRMNGIYFMTFLPYGFSTLAHTAEVMHDAAKIINDTLDQFHAAGMFPTSE